jgi:Protein of unknown function (DUF1557).
VSSTKLTKARAQEMKSIRNSRFIENADTCFVAGTLVHTKNGLVPIEKIMVGDYVLSKPESGDGEISYQKVIKTFVHEEQPVLCVDVCGWTVDDGVKAELTRQLVDNSNDFPLIVTPNHLFWVVDKGWVKAEHLRYGIDVVKMANGHQHYINDVSDVMRTDDPDIGFLVGGSYCPIRFSNSESRAIFLKNNEVYTSYEFEDRIENEAVEWWDRNAVDVLKRTVFNIEVEHTHTFFVGKIGVWVHE